MALLEHDLVIQCKKGSNMPGDYLSQFLGTKEAVSSILAFNPFQSNLYDLKIQHEHLQMLQYNMTKLTCQNMIATTSRPWWTELFKTKIMLSGPRSQIATIPGWLSIYQRNTSRRPCVRNMTVFLEDTM
jgi:hypothetical protein